MENMHDLPNSFSKPTTPLTMEEISIDIDWGIIRGKKYGIGSRNVLGIHGWLDNANTFDLTVPYIEDGITFISIDLPGHGLSSNFPPGFFFGIESYVGAIKKVIMRLQWKTFTLLAHSIGAIIGIVYCAVFPEDVHTFISIDMVNPWSLKPEDWARNLKAYFQNYFKNEELYNKTPLEYKEDELIQRTIEGSKESLDIESAKILLERSSRLSDCGTKRVLVRDLRAKVHFIGFIPFNVWCEYAKTIKCPILIIKATGGRLYGSQDDYEAMLSAFKKGSSLYRYFELEGRHHLHITRPTVVGPVLKDYFQITRTFVEKTDIKI